MDLESDEESAVGSPVSELLIFRYSYQICEQMSLIASRICVLQQNAPPYTACDPTEGLPCPPGPLTSAEMRQAVGMFLSRELVEEHVGSAL